MEQLIREGMLERYITTQRSPRKRSASPVKDKERRNPVTQRISEPKRAREDQEDIKTIIRTINVIAEGFAGSSITKLAYRKHLQEVLSLLTAKMKKAHKPSSTPKIIFSSSNIEGII